MTARIILLFTLLLSMNVAGQQVLNEHKLDSLVSVIEDSSRPIMDRLSAHSWIIADPLIPVEFKSKYASQYRVLSRKANDKNEELNALTWSQSFYTDNLFIDSLAIVIDEEIALGKREKDNKILARGMSDKGWMNARFGGEEGIKKSIPYFKKAYELYGKENDTFMMAEARSRLMYNRFRSGDLSGWREDQKAIEKILRSPAVEDGYIEIYFSNLAHIYDSLKNYDSAIVCRLRVVQMDSIRLIESGFRSTLGKELSLLGSYYLKKKEFEKAEKLLLDAELVSLSPYDKSYTYLWLCKLYEAMGNPEKALKYYKLYHSVYNHLWENQTSRMEKSIEAYRTNLSNQKSLNEAQQESILKEQEAQKQSRNFWIAFSASGGLLFLGMLLFVLFYRKRKALEESERLQQELAVQKERAERSEAFKQQFLANMSHEIRTPMNAVLGMTNLVLNTELTDKQRNYLEKVKISSDNLLHIINDILDLSKVESGKMELEQIDFSLKETLDLVKHTLEMKADEKGLALFTQMDTDVEDVVIGDPIRLNQVLLNLTNNALKFTEHGSVLIKLSKTESKIRFEVTDTGIGIPNDKIEQVFESFRQANTADTREYGGTGLGLTISQELIHLMGGEISIESEVGKGTTFSFELELETGDATRYEQRKNSTLVLDGNVLNGLTILLADDNEYNRIVARDTLEGIANVAVIEAENGQEVIEKLGDDVDVILMDVQMPVMSGFEATKEIRESDTAYSNIPIIALTASVLRSDLDKCKDAGMNAYVPKPFRTFELIKAIAEVLKLKVKEKEVNTPKSKEQVIDLDHLHDFCDGDEKKIAKYKKLFLEGAEEFRSELDNYLEKEDAIAIADLIHKFNTRLALMGMKKAKELSVNLENSLRDGESTVNLMDSILELKVLITRGRDEIILSL